MRHAGPLLGTPCAARSVQGRPVIGAIVEAVGRHAPAAEVSLEWVGGRWAQIGDMAQARPFASATEALLGAFRPPGR